jgi:hypothetical protein
MHNMTHDCTKTLARLGLLLGLGLGLGLGPGLGLGTWYLVVSGWVGNKTSSVHSFHLVYLVHTSDDGFGFG